MPLESYIGSTCGFARPVSPSQSFSLASRSADAILRASLYADSANQAPISQALGRSFSTEKKREKRNPALSFLFSVGQVVHYFFVSFPCG